MYTLSSIQTGTGQSVALTNERADGYRCSSANREQVIIPKEKQFIWLEGEDSSSTVVQWNAHAEPADAETATAAFAGRHFFSQCWIEGGVDFIFGIAASVYEGCTLNSILIDEGPSWFTAHAKVNVSAPGGFVFKNCNLTGSGNMYLGRAWNEYSTVLFYESFMSGLVVPLGWDSWQHDVSHITYAETNCIGPGSNMSQRVPWEKQLGGQDWDVFVGSEFNDQDGWIEQHAP
ncbi:hypothetical protein LUZ63_012328 [Rhynchospora breviuscula]|uniref:pectinesterase n=1 Tax=Rhynchospora breviuscula TaxID=2022672 RepID=A0A9Q0CKX2_9POAL|nr:hypothetical protein LUZ63_012328 [Rhynchospora breviuscula]